MKRSNSVLLGLILLMSMTVYVPTVDAQVEPEVSVAVSVAPLQGIVEGVGGDFAQVSTLLPEGVEPHAAQLPQSSIDAADSADLLVLTGHFPWEEQLLEQVDTPAIDIVDYEKFGAVLLPMPGSDGKLDPLAQDQDHGNKNIHSYWLLPRNAIAIANATRDKLDELVPERSDFWASSFQRFVDDIGEFQDLVLLMDEEYRFSDLHAVVVFPAEAYVAEVFGIQVVAVLEAGEDVFISGADLLTIQTGLANGSIDIILGSDIARLQQGGEFAVQLASDTNSRIVWWRVIFFSGLSDYTSIMSYNLGALVSALENEGQNTMTSLIDYLPVAIAAFLAIVVVTETILLLQFVRKEQ